MSHGTTHLTDGWTPIGGSTPRATARPTRRPSIPPTRSTVTVDPTDRLTIVQVLRAEGVRTPERLDGGGGRRLPTPRCRRRRATLRGDRPRDHRARATSNRRPPVAVENWMVHGWQPDPATVQMHDFDGRDIGEVRGSSDNECVAGRAAASPSSLRLDIDADPGWLRQRRLQPSRRRRPRGLRGRLQEARPVMTDLGSFSVQSAELRAGAATLWTARKPATCGRPATRSRTRPREGYKFGFLAGIVRRVDDHYDQFVAADGRGLATTGPTSTSSPPPSSPTANAYDGVDSTVAADVQSPGQDDRRMSDPTTFADFLSSSTRSTGQVPGRRSGTRYEDDRRHAQRRRRLRSADVVSSDARHLDGLTDDIEGAIDKWNNEIEPG